jgi:hypothetical protein
MPWTGRSAYLRREEIADAFNANSDSSDRRGCSALAGQPLHTDAGNDQVHLECSRDHLRGVVASECVWTIS